MDCKDTFSYCLKSELPESKHQLHWHHDQEPSNWDFETWLIGKLYSLIQREGTYQSQVLYDYPSGKEKQIYDFLDFHFSKYNGSFSNFKRALKFWIDYLGRTRYKDIEGLSFGGLLYNEINEFVSEWMANKTIIDEDESTGTKPPPKPTPTITLPVYVLKWLQDTIGDDGKTYIKDAEAKKLKWLKNKQTARVLLTHKNIRGDLDIEQAVKQAPSIFIDKDGQDLHLAKNDTRQENRDTDKLKLFLDKLKSTTT